MYTPHQSAVLCWGKLRRVLLVGLARKKVEAKLVHRHGSCARCGACCRILFHCPSLDCSNGTPRCLIYDNRPGMCIHFPLDPADLRDRDIVMPGSKCGFHFNGTAVPLPAAARRVPRNGHRRTFTGTMALLRSFFHRPNGHV